MKKIYHSLKLALLIMVLGLPVTLQAQTYSAWGVPLSGGPYDDLDVEEDTLRFQFSGIPAGIYGTAKIVIYYEGDFGDGGETLTPYLATSSTGSNLSSFASFGETGMDCAPEDSIEYTFSAGVIVSNGLAIGVKLYPTFDVGPTVCTAGTRAKVRLEVEVCAGGVPTPATITIASSTACPGQLVNLFGTPAGGTFSGSGVTGSVFDGTGMHPGMNPITYTAIDPTTGCEVSATDMIQVAVAPTVSDIVACEGVSVDITTSGVYAFYHDAALTDGIDTTDAIIGYGPLYDDEIIYVSNIDVNNTFTLNSVTGLNSEFTEDTDMWGDDRGGIAVTRDHVFISTDGGVVRFNTDFTSPVLLPMRDGMFSDLYSGALYSLYNSADGDPGDWPSTFTVDALMRMDNMLEFTSPTTLSMPITVDDGSAIFAGMGIVILWVEDTDNFYVIDVQTGAVTNLGPSMGSFYPAYAENWLRWGVAEYDGADYSVVFRDDYSSDILRMNLSTGNITTVASFSNLEDLASFTYSRWENKWFWKYEYAGEFGGFNEVAGKCDASGTFTVTPGIGAFGCVAELNVHVPKADLGADQTVCQGEEAEFSIGLGYSSITWNGDNNDENTFSTTTGGEVVVEAVDVASGCVLYDTAVVTINALPTVTFNLTDDHACLTQTTFPLTGAAPAGGTFTGSFVTGANFNATTAGAGTHVVTYTYTDANGCENMAQDAVFVDACLGVNELDNDMISLYPNPAQNNITINAGSFVNQLVNIEVYDAQGKVVYSEKSTLNQNHVLNVSALNNGIYHVSLSVEGNRSMARLVIQK